ncbi:MAG TPA: serine protease [Gemmataceae bacterium]|jgi:hypothetical protein|nr:serine protease [Gemmataceae bacterium]
MKMFRTLVPLAAIFGLPLFAMTPRAGAEDSESVALYKKVVDSAVFIVTPLGGNAIAMGSGSLIDLERHLVITNYHVVDEQDKVFVQFAVHLKDGTIMTDKKKYMERVEAKQASVGTVLFRDKSRDLALVKLDKVPLTAKPITLAKKSVSLGDVTFNIGSPGAVSQIFSFTEGEVRSVGMEDLVVGGGDGILRVKCKMITATNAINPGDSGGPLFNKKGEQVGVTESHNRTASLVCRFVDVEEVHGFLKEKKVSYKDGSGIAVTPESPLPKQGSQEAVKPKEGTGATAEPGAPTAATEAAATSALRSARLFKDSDDDRPVYIAKLKDVVAKYPGTAAAKEAKKTLDSLK